MSFTHLHVHSHYSLLDGLSKIPDLVGHAKKLGMTSLALTDHGSLYGAVEFYQECKKQGIKPIIGVELYVAPRKLTDKQPKLDTKPYHLVVLAETIEGYNNLLSIVSKAHLDGYYYKPRVDIDLLNKYSTGLIALSSCLNGEVAKALVNKNIDAAEEVVRKYQDVFGQNNFFLEAQHNPTIPEQQIVNNGIIELSKRTGAELVATADSHYLLPDDAEAQDILVCIQTKHQLADEKRLSMRAEDYSLASPQQMQSWFPDMPEAVQNTDKIAARCNIELPLNEIHMPYYELPIGKTADEVLRELCIEGIEKRYQITNEAISKRLDYELSIINKTGYASYFLIVQDLVNWAKEQGIVVGPGRGSAAGSIVAYLTSITNIDPIKYDLLFERFLNPERVSMPDIDLDIADIRRDEVISYVEEKYGKDHVAQIITFGTMAARAAVRDVGRVLGISYGYCDTIAKLIPMFTNLDEAMKTVPELRDLYQSDPDAMRLLDGARKLEGVVRHTSTHACGVVITEKPLENYTPVQYSSASDDAIITQYSLHPVEALGLLKMDFLGLKNLTIIEDALGIIKKTTDEVIDIEKITLEDKKTYKLLKEGHTTGIFQLESAGMKRYLRTLKPTEFEDIIAMVALYRPGPMERIPDYVDGKHGRREIRYLHPDLKPILEKTYGILVYQEQVMAMVRDLAGFTAGEGYLLIKAVAKKISKLLNEQEAKFISGCEKNGISKNIADKLWAFIEPFAKYGFNKSHSTGYALIAYQTAYLKANYAPQFMASLLTADQDDSDRIAIEVQEARDMGITVMPPDINESFSTFTVVKESLSGKPRIRFGLAAIKNVGQKLVTAIIAERKSGGPFKSIEDLLKRIHQKDLNKKSLESLIKSGSFDGLDESSRLLHNLETLLIYNKQVQSEKASGQTNIFGQLPVENTPQLHFKESGLVDERQKLQWEKELLGLYVSAHPLEKLKDNLPAS
ncbi:MAG: DNA polymerase III subunit alpha, partial [bacterium]|nr:DNA polymerase III subunit alpha [bacterium]